jgi:hypothetical protein
MNKVVKSAFFREQMKRSWPLILLTLIGFTFFVIFPIYIHGGGRDVYISAKVMIEVLAMEHPFMIITSILLPFVVAMILFSPIFGKKSATTAYQMAGGKDTLFWSNFLAGIVLILVPLLIASLLLLIPVRFPTSFNGLEALTYPADLFTGGLSGNQIINTLPVIMAFFARIAVTALFYFMMIILMVSISGSRMVAGVLSLIVPFIPNGLERFVTLVQTVYVFGYDRRGLPPMEEVLGYANPLRWFGQTFVEGVAYVIGVANVARPTPDRIMTFTNPITWAFNWGRETQGLYFLVYLVITIGLLILAYLAFINRRIEGRGELIVFPWVRGLIIFLISVTAMIATGRFLMDLVTGRWFLYYGFVLGFVIAFCIALMIFERSFNILHKLKLLMPAMGVTVILYGIMLLVTTFALHPFTHYVPDVDRVAGVYVSTEERFSRGQEFITDDEVIQEVIHLHELILDIRYDLSRDEYRDLSSSDRRDVREERRDHNRNMREVFWESISGGGGTFRDGGGKYLFITYELTNGDRIYRRYVMSGSFLEAVAVGL